MQHLWVYKKGDTGIITILPDGKQCPYSKKSREDFEGVPDTVIDTPDNIMLLIKEATRKIFLCDPWKKITEKDWDIALSDVPPERWHTVDGVEIFRSGEPTCGTISTHYAHDYESDTYWCNYKELFCKYEDIAKEIKEIVK